MLVTLEALSLQLPVVGATVNRAPFTGILTRLDEPSTRPPNGSEGHLVLMPSDVAAQALASLLGMGVNTTDDFRGHAKQSKIGVITDARIDGQDLVISGILYDKDFPEEVAAIRADKERLGMSYELSSVDVADPDADVWILTSFVFTGAAILYKEAAAYHQTAIAAQSESSKEEDTMSKEILEALAAIRSDIQTLQAAADDETDKDAAKDCPKEEDAANGTSAIAEDAAANTEAAAAVQAMSALMKAMGYPDEEEAADDKKVMMRHMMKAMLKSMAYPGGGFGGEHEDEEEDVALFQRMMRQGKLAASKKTVAAKDPIMAGVQRQLKDVTAALGLITDTMKRQTGLITDVMKTVGKLATDENRGAQGGPARKTMAAEGSEQWAGKFQGQELEAGSKDLQAAMHELETQMDRDKITSPRDRIAKKLDLQTQFLQRNGATTSR